MKISGLKDVFSSKTQKVDYTSLRSYIVQLQNGTINATQFATNIKGLNIATQQEAQAVLRLNAELQQGLINEQGYKAGLDQISMSLRQAQIATEQLTLKTRLMQGAMKLATGGLNLIIGMASTIALSALTKAISDAVTENERLAESAKESAEAFNSQNDGLEELKQKYIEVFDGELDEKQKTEQLTEIKKELINQYDIEEEKLKNINTARQDTIDLLNEETKTNRDKWLNENKDVIATAKKEIDRNMQPLQDIASISFTGIGNIDKSVLELMKISDDEYGFKSLSVYSKNLIEFYDTYDKIAGLLTSKQLTKGLSDEEKTLLNRARDVTNTYKNILENNREVYETEAEYSSKILFEAFLNTKGNELENITIQNINQWKERLTDELNNSNLGIQAKENIQNLMVNALKEINLSPEIQVSPKFKYDEQAVNDAVAKVETMFNGSDDDKSTIFDKIEKFEKAIENIGKNGFIERADYEELLEIYPELENVLKQTADGYNASLLDMENSTEEFINENINTISEAQAVVSNQKTELNKQIAEIDKKIFEARKGGYDNRYEIEQLYEIRNAYLMQNDTLDETNAKLKEYKANLQIDVEKNMLDATTESIGNLNSSMKMLSNAFNEINENGTLSVDTLLTLIESGYATAIMYNNQTGAITLNKKVIEELTKAKITAQIAELQSKLATSQHTKEIEAQIIALTNLRDNWNKIYDGSFTNTSKDDTTDNVSDVKEDTTDYYKENAEAQIEALKHEYEIGNLSTENYYNQLLDLAKYYYEGKAEYLDDYRKYEEEVYKGLQEAQKERLENEKEKISEVNEENEKSLELIKAHLELENARKNKTIRSYSEETGFNYTTDEKDILDKKLALDKLIAETKERFIDNQIDEIDKMNFDELRNALNTPISIPTNEEIMQESYRQTAEYITNNNRNNNSNSYTINVDKIVTDNPQDFLNQLNELLQIGINNSRVGL